MNRLTWAVRQSTARHAFHTLSFALHRVNGRLAKHYSTFTLSDEAYAMTALLGVLALDAIRDRRHNLPTPALAMLAALIARLPAPGQMLLTAFGLFTTALRARHFAAHTRPIHA
ncbi:hypothetical protein [Streptomyces pristinaespiralis]|uniref:hypothetical protein n=1 Tax=Streptomyces pristinaespiralis TaxID=38300 RepID=UPI003407590F